MFAQASDPDEETSLPFRVETDEASLSQDTVSRRSSTFFMWIGTGLAVLMLLGLSAWALHPLASHGSAEPSHLGPEAAAYIFQDPAVYDPMPAPSSHAVAPGRHSPVTGYVGGSSSRRAVLQPGVGRRSTRLMYTKDATNEPNLRDAWRSRLEPSSNFTSFEEYVLAATPPEVDLDLEKVIQAWQASAFKELGSGIGVTVDKIHKDQVMRDTVAILELMKDDREAGVSDHLFGLAFGTASPEDIQALACVMFAKQDDPSGELADLALQEGFTLNEAAGVPILVVEVTMFVAKPAARRGVGRELMNKIIDWAKLRGKLLALEPANEELRTYYKSLGFVEIANRRLVHFGVRKAEPPSQGLVFEVAP